MNENPLMNADLASKVLNNFKKISEWCVKGGESQYPLPPAIKNAAQELAEASSGVAEVREVISSLQKRVIDQERKINHLEGTLAGVNQALETLIEAHKAASSASDAPQEDQQQQQQQQVQQATTQAAGGLEDLGPVDPAPGPSAEAVAAQSEPAAAQDNQAEPVAANDKEVELTAKNIDAGNISPDGLDQLDAEIDALMASN